MQAEEGEKSTTTTRGTYVGEYVGEVGEYLGDVAGPGEVGEYRGEVGE